MKNLGLKVFSLTTEEFWEKLKSKDGLACFGSWPNFQYWAFNLPKNCVDFSDPSCGVWSYDFEHFKKLDEKIAKLFDGSKEKIELSKELNTTEKRLYTIRISIDRINLRISESPLKK